MSRKKDDFTTESESTSVDTIHDESAGNQSDDEEENETYDQDENDGEGELHFASRAEIKEEAIRRMRQIGIYGPIIDDFINNDNPQVYEYPNGVGYSLEDDERQHVINVENKRKILVWGISRSGLKFSGRICKIDNMFFVSNIKEYWDDERKQLYSKVPQVYAYNYDIPKLSEMGCICIFMSQGGTPLRENHHPFSF